MNNTRENENCAVKLTGFVLGTPCGGCAVRHCPICRGVIREGDIPTLPKVSAETYLCPHCNKEIKLSL